VNGLGVHPGRTFDDDIALRPSTIVVPIDDPALASSAVAIGRRWADTFGADLVVASIEGEHDRSDLERMQLDPSEVRTVPERPALIATVFDIVAQHTPVAVVVATRAGSPVVEVLRDDIAQELVRSVEVPVVLVGPHCPIKQLDGPVVVTHDGTPGVPSALDPARVFAAALGSPSVLLHVHQPVVGSASDALATLRSAQERLGPDTALEIVTSSFPAGAIREFAHEVDASLLALSTRGRTGMLTASTGRTATWVVRESRCAVLVAHPPALSEH
jgi:nucleotide-binding universal stress UspA family protein